LINKFIARNSASNIFIAKESEGYAAFADIFTLDIDLGNAVFSS